MRPHKKKKNPSVPSSLCFSTWKLGLWRRHLLVNEEGAITPSEDPFAGTNCTPPAIEEFPRPIIPQYVRAKGGLLVHLLIAAYMFLGLSVVCDDYFVPALERMVECTYALYCSFIFTRNFSILTSRYSAALAKAKKKKKNLVTSFPTIILNGYVRLFKMSTLSTLTSH